MVRQNAFKMRCWADVIIGLESGVTTGGYNHIKKSITRNTTLRYMLLCCKYNLFNAFKRVPQC